MGRHLKPYTIGPQDAAKQLGINESTLYRYARAGQLEGITSALNEPLAFDRRKLKVRTRPHGNRIHVPGSGRTQIVHSPAELDAWIKRATAEGYTSLAAWIRKCANRAAGVK